MIPKGFVGCGRNAGIEMGTGDGPSVGGANSICQEPWIIIGVGVSERFFGGVEEVLTVKEDERSFDFWLDGQLPSPTKKNPAGGPKADPAGGKSLKIPLLVISNNGGDLSTLDLGAHVRSLARGLQEHVYGFQKGFLLCCRQGFDTV